MLNVLNASTIKQDFGQLKQEQQMKLRQDSSDVKGAIMYGEMLLNGVF